MIRSVLCGAVINISIQLQHANEREEYVGVRWAWAMAIRNRSRRPKTCGDPSSIRAIWTHPWEWSSSSYSLSHTHKKTQSVKTKPMLCYDTPFFFYRVLCCVSLPTVCCCCLFNRYEANVRLSSWCAWHTVATVALDRRYAEGDGPDIYRIGLFFAFYFSKLAAVAAAAVDCWAFMRMNGVDCGQSVSR